MEKKKENNNQKRKLALVMLSGGLDSAVALYWSLKHGFRVNTITFDYFLRSKREIKAAADFAKFVGCAHYAINLSFLKEIEDCKYKKLNPRLGEAPSAYISSRNMIFYGIASSVS